VHLTGLIREAVRSTTSLPAIYPPFCGQNGDIYIDGGLLNNMPVDIMRQYIDGGKVIALDCNPNIPTRKRKCPNKPWVSGWSLLSQHLIPFRQRHTTESIFTIITGSINLGAMEHEEIMKNEADGIVSVNTMEFELMQFKSFNDIFAVGYQTAMDTLPNLITTLF
jgi:predicted acylesterase/phospholipase RssA